MVALTFSALSSNEAMFLIAAPLNLTIFLLRVGFTFAGVINLGARMIRTWARSISEIESSPARSFPQTCIDEDWRDQSGFWTDRKMYRHVVCS